MLATPGRPRQQGIVCRHCDHLIRGDGRGLCFRCHGDPAIRRLYPILRKSKKRPWLDEIVGGHTLPTLPTQAVPGSETKILVLMDRATAGLALFHPDDYFSPDGESQRIAAGFVTVRG